MARSFWFSSSAIVLSILCGLAVVDCKRQDGQEFQGQNGSSGELSRAPKPLQQQAGNQADKSKDEVETADSLIANATSQSIEGQSSSLPVNLPGSEPSSNPFKTLVAAKEDEFFHEAVSGEEQTQAVCSRFTAAGKKNIVIKAFCDTVPPQRPKSLIELQAALNVSIAPGQTANGTRGFTAFALAAHSTSLVGRYVSQINPRAVLFHDPVNNPNPAKPDAVALTFVRGEPLVEVAAKNPDGSFDFFVVAFAQACQSKAGGCSMQELLTPAIESNWTGVSLFDEEDLKNSLADCRQCHQPDGPGTVKMLRMHELVLPWTHWFAVNIRAAAPLFTDFQAAHGTSEAYAGIPGALIAQSQPLHLENFIRGQGFVDPAAVVSRVAGAQPNQFDSVLIPLELAIGIQARPPAGCQLIQASPSSTWNMAYTNYVNRNDACDPNVGRPGFKRYKAAMPPPFYEAKVTDPNLLNKYTQQYADFLAGKLTTAFQDHRNILVTDPKKLALAGFAVDPAADPATTLRLACASCHNSELDQSLSRARFNAMDFNRMSNLNSELDLAILRLKLGYSEERLNTERIRFVQRDGKPVSLERGQHTLTMPPRRFRSLTDAQIDSLVNYLEQQKK